MCCSNEEKDKLEEVILACLRCGESNVLENILGKILERRKLIDWKVRVRYLHYHNTDITTRHCFILAITIPQKAAGTYYRLLPRTRRFIFVFLYADRLLFVVLFDNYVF